MIAQVLGTDSSLVLMVSSFALRIPFLVLPKHSDSSKTYTFPLSFSPMAAVSRNPTA